LYLYILTQQLLLVRQIIVSTATVLFVQGQIEFTDKIRSLLVSSDSFSSIDIHFRRKLSWQKCGTSCWQRSRRTVSISTFPLR